MKLSSFPPRALHAVLIAASLLPACGGSDGGSDAPVTQTMNTGIDGGTGIGSSGTGSGTGNNGGGTGTGNNDGTRLPAQARRRHCPERNSRLLRRR